METVQLIILSVTQGITEFIPVSSSAHLILVSQIFNWDDQGIFIDTTAHLGSLSAFASFIFCDKFRGNKDKNFFFEDRIIVDYVFVKKIILATMPALVLGYLFRDVIVQDARNPTVIGLATIIFALIMLAADHRRGSRKVCDLNYKEVILIGLVQSLALIPGVSRSGATLAAALFLGLSRVEGLKFAVILSVPIIIFASFSEFRLLLFGVPKVDLFDLIFVFFGSMLSSFLCLLLLFKFINRIGLLPFVIYRLVLGALILIFLT